MHCYGLPFFADDVSHVAFWTSCPHVSPACTHSLAHRVRCMLCGMHLSGSRIKRPRNANKKMATGCHWSVAKIRIWAWWMLTIWSAGEDWRFPAVRWRWTGDLYYYVGSTNTSGTPTNNLGGKIWTTKQSIVCSTATLPSFSIIY